MSGSDSPTFFHGQPWSSWIEKIGRDKPLSDDETEDEPRSSVMRLAAEDIDLYGFCPERDTFYGVVCEICNAIVKPQALIQHMEIRHPSGTVNLPPPATPVVKPIAKTAYCKVSKLKKSQSSSGQSQSQIASSSSNNSNNNNNKSNSNSTNKRTAEQANLQPQLPLNSPRSPLENIPIQITNAAVSTVANTSSPVKSPGSGNQPRRKKLKTERSLLKDREYDPDRHCGVWNEETSKPCTRSLTCKAHTVSLRRTVSGRSKTFDKLLADHRAAKEFPPRSTKVTVTVSAAVGNLNTMVIGASNSTVESSTPSSPPVLSLPDMYPLPKTKLEEDFANEELSLESSMQQVNSSTNSSSSMTTPISVLLPSLSPIPAKNNTGDSPIATLIPAATVSPAPSMVPASLPTNQPLISNILEAETPVELHSESITIYSPISAFKDAGKSQIIVQIPGANNNPLNSPVAKSYPAQASMPCLSLFESSLQPPGGSGGGGGGGGGLINQITTNGKRATSHHGNLMNASGGMRAGVKRSKTDCQQEYSTAIQVEATTTSTPYPHFSEISWSNCHPEPLAVSRWLRITSNRKQYNFNIH